MNTVEIQNVAYVQTVMERINHYLKNSPLSKSTVSFGNNILEIQFQSINSEDSKLPSNEQIMQIKNIVFWDSKIELPYEKNLVEYNADTKIMTINMKCYNITSEFFHKMTEFGVNVTGFDISTDDFCFFYSICGRYHFDYNELETLQAIIDPTIQRHDSIRIVGFDGTYTLRVKFNR